MFNLAAEIIAVIQQHGWINGDILLAGWKNVRPFHPSPDCPVLLIPNG